MIKIGVVGYGYWGPNFVRNFQETDGTEVVAVSDLREDRLVSLRKRYPSIEAIFHDHDLLSDRRIGAVAIATPVSSHFDLALKAIQAGKHVLLAKPLAATAEQAQRLMIEAERRNLVLMVDHTFVYTGAVQKMRDLVEAGELGEIYYYDSVRVNLGLFQHDINVIWDLAPHDLSILDFVTRLRPCAVSATGMSHVTGQPENTAYLTLFFDGSFLAHVHVNWLAPVKVRRTLIGGSKKMIVYDDLEPSEKIKVYDKGLLLENEETTRYQMLAGYRTGDIWSPQLDMTEALRTEASHFVSCIENGERPMTDGSAGLRVVQVLEAATQSMRERGRPVELPRDRE